MQSDRKANLRRRIGKNPNYIYNLENEKEQLTFADFVDIVQALEFDPTEVLDEIIHWAKD